MKKIVFLISAFLALYGAKTYSQDVPNTTTTTTTTTTTASPTVVVDVNESNEHFKRGYIGVVGLASWTDIKLKNIDNSTISTSTTLGWGGGGLIGVDLSRHFDLELEVLYAALAQKYKNTFNTNDELDVKYINIPLLLGLNTDASKPVNLNITAGPQLGLNVGSSIKHADTGQQMDTVNAILSVKKGDIGIAFGASLDFRIAEALKLSLGYRGVRGIVDISDNSQNITTRDFYILDRSKVNTNSAFAALSILF